MAVYDEQKNFASCELYGASEMRPRDHLVALLVTLGIVAALALIAWVGHFVSGLFS